MRWSSAAAIGDRWLLVGLAALVAGAALGGGTARAGHGPELLQTPLISVGTKGVRLKYPVEYLASDGNRVAYSFCGQLVAWWTPGSRTGGRFGLPAQFTCPPPSSPERVYSLAVASGQVGFAVNYGGIQTNSWIKAVSFAQPANVRIVASQVACCRGSPAGEGRMGFVVGQGSLLAFTSWQLCGDPGGPSCGIGAASIVASTVYSVSLPPSAGSTCPGEPYQCTQIGTAPSLVGAIAADSGRLALLRADGSLAVIDASGAIVSIYPVTTWGQTLAAELSGNELILLGQGSLRELDAATGALLHTWPVANVPSGGTCRRLPCPQQQLTLEDAAGGLVAYTLQGAVHVLRLPDGRDVAVALGTRARFVTTGLVFAYEGTGTWPAGLRLLPSAQIAALLGP